MTAICIIFCEDWSIFFTKNNSVILSKTWSILALSTKRLFSIFKNGEFGRTFLDLSTPMHSVLEWIHRSANSCAIELVSWYCQKSFPAKRNSSSACFPAEQIACCKAGQEANSSGNAGSSALPSLFKDGKSNCRELYDSFLWGSNSKRNVNSGRYVQFFLKIQRHLMAFSISLISTPT